VKTLFQILFFQILNLYRHDKFLSIRMPRIEAGVALTDGGAAVHVESS
jgi:hypothetical protein